MELGESMCSFFPENRLESDETPKVAKGPHKMSRHFRFIPCRALPGCRVRALSVLLPSTVYRIR